MMLPRIEPLIFWLQLPNPTLQSVKAPSKVTRIQLPSVLCCGEGGRTRLASGWGRGWGVACDYVNKLVQFASRSRVGGNSKGSRECVRNTAEGLTYGRWIKRYRDQNDMLPMTLSITTNSTSVNVLYTISNVKKIFFFKFDTASECSKAACTVTLMIDILHVYISTSAKRGKVRYSTILFVVTLFIFLFHKNSNWIKVIHFCFTLNK